MPLSRIEQIQSLSQKVSPCRFWVMQGAVRNLFAGPWRCGNEDTDLSSFIAEGSIDLFSTLLRGVVDPNDDMTADRLTDETVEYLLLSFLAEDLGKINPLVEYLVDNPDDRTHSVLWKDVPIPAPQFVIPAACVLSAYNSVADWLKRLKHLGDQDQAVGLRCFQPAPDGNVSFNGRIYKEQETDFAPIFSFLKDNEPFRVRFEKWLSLPLSSEDAEIGYRKSVNDVLTRMAKMLGITSRDQGFLTDAAWQLIAATRGCSCFWFNVEKDDALAFSADKLKDVWSHSPKVAVSLKKSWGGDQVESVEVPAHALFDDLALRDDESKLKASLKQEYCRPQQNAKDAAKQLLKLSQSIKAIYDLLDNGRLIIVGCGLPLEYNVYKEFYNNCQSAIDSLLEDNEALWRAAHKVIAEKDFIEKVGQFSLVGREGYKNPVFRWQGKLTDREFTHKGADELRPLIDRKDYQQVWDFILKMHSVNRMIHLIERANAQRLKELSAEQLRRLNAWKNPDSFDEPDAANPEANQGKIRSLLKLFLEVSRGVRGESFDLEAQRGLAGTFKEYDGITALDDFAHVNDELKKEDYDEFFSKMNVADIDALNVQTAANPPAAAQNKNIIQLAAFYHSLCNSDQAALKRILFEKSDGGVKKVAALIDKLGDEDELDALKKKGDATPGPTGEEFYEWGKLNSEKDFIMKYVRNDAGNQELIGVLKLGKKALKDGLKEDRFDACMETYKPRPKEASTDIILKGLAQGIVDLSKNIDAFFELRQETYGSEGWGKAKKQLLDYAKKDNERDGERFGDNGAFRPTSK